MKRTWPFSSSFSFSWPFPSSPFPNAPPVPPPTAPTSFTINVKNAEQLVYTHQDHLGVTFDLPSPCSPRFSSS